MKSAFVQIEDNLYRNIVCMDEYGILDWISEFSETRRVVIGPDAENRIIGGCYARGIAVKPNDIKHQLKKTSKLTQATVADTVKKESEFLRMLIMDEGLDAEVSAPIDNTGGEEQIFSPHDYVIHVLGKFDEIYLATTRCGIEGKKMMFSGFPAEVVP